MSDSARTVQMAGPNLVTNHARPLGFHQEVVEATTQGELILAKFDSAKLSQALWRRHSRGASGKREDFRSAGQAHIQQRPRATIP